jgi:hypothetical protein
MTVAETTPGIPRLQDPMVILDVTPFKWEGSLNFSGFLPAGCNDRYLPHVLLCLGGKPAHWPPKWKGERRTR